MTAAAVLHRHQLVYLSTTGWRELLASAPARVAQPLRDWSRRDLPLVVTRQPEGLPAGRLALGWAGPLSAERCRAGLEIAAESVERYAEFPGAGEALPLVPSESRAMLQQALDALQQLGARPRVYGSYGWQLVTGLAYVRPVSDLDLWIAVQDPEQADAVAQVLHACATRPLRLDGELVFAGGGAVAWREYAAWRAGRSPSLLVKRLDKVGLARTLEEAVAA